MLRPLVDEAEQYQEDLGELRSEYYARYRAEPYGNEQSGWATSIDPVIWDAIEGMMPTLLGIFNDDWFQLSGPSQERASAFKKLINYQLYRKQEGYQEILAFLKDCLLYHYGVAKITYVEDYEEEMQTFRQLSAQDMANIAGNPDVTISRYDEVSVMDPITGGTITSYERVKLVKRIPRYKGPMFECLPPWEFGFTPGYPRLDDCPLVYHKVRRTLSYIRQKELDGIYGPGSYEKVKSSQYVEPLEDEALEYNDTQSDADSSLTDDAADASTMTSPQLIPAIEVDVYECYVKMDVDEDGILEDMIVTLCGDVVLRMDENPYRRPPFRLGKAYPESHKIPGIPLASVLEEDQKVMTNLKRMAQDAAAQSVYTNPITDDPNLYKLLLNRKPNDPLLGNPQRLGKLEINPPHEFVLKTIEMIQGDVENKSGVTRYNQGTEGESLNKTARGVSIIATMAQQRLKLVARNIGNTAMKGVIRDFIYIDQKWPPEEAIRVLQHEIPITPDDLAGEYDIAIDVGVGVQEKQMAAHMVDELVQFSLQAGLQLKMATPTTIYKALQRKYELLDIDTSDLLINPEEMLHGQQAGPGGPPPGGPAAGGPPGGPPSGPGAGQPGAPPAQGPGVPGNAPGGGGVLQGPDLSLIAGPGE